MKKEITPHDLYLLLIDSEDKIQIQEGWVDEGIFHSRILIERTTLGIISSRLFDANSIEAKIWNRPIRWIDNDSRDFYIIMLNKEE